MQSNEVDCPIAHFSHTYSRIIFKTLKRVYCVQMNASLSVIFNHLGMYLKLLKRWGTCTPNIRCTELPLQATQLRNYIPQHLRPFQADFV